MRTFSIAALGIAFAMAASTASQASEFTSVRIDERSRAVCPKSFDTWNLNVQGETISLRSSSGGNLDLRVPNRGSFTSQPFRSASSIQWVMSGNVATGEFFLENRSLFCWYRLVPKNSAQQAERK